MTETRNIYHFDDFTRDAYRGLLLLAKTHYNFRGYRDFARDERFVLWRHDVDMSMHAALALANIEAEEGVSATYFLLASGPFYNLLEPSIRPIIREIESLGHSIGLHFDSKGLEIVSQADLEKHLTHQKRFLEEYCGCHIEAFSFHNPTTALLALDAMEYAGMVNSYAAYFREHLTYCSDSNGYWRHARLEDVLREATAPRLQVLTHPEWWTETAMSPEARVMRCIDGRAAANARDYRDSLARYGRKNVGDS